MILSVSTFFNINILYYQIFSLIHTREFTKIAILQTKFKLGQTFNPILLNLFRAIDSSTAGLQKPSKLPFVTQKLLKLSL